MVRDLETFGRLRLHWLLIPANGETFFLLRNCPIIPDRVIDNVRSNTALELSRIPSECMAIFLRSLSHARSRFLEFDHEFAVAAACTKNTSPKTRLLRIYTVR